ncbi:MAG: N-acetylmuramoyl-L-alanine amidase [Chthonomonadales bacterium]
MKTSNIRPVASLAFLLSTTLCRAGLCGQLTPVALKISGKEVSLKTPAMFDGKEVYIPLDAFKSFHANYRLTAKEETVVLTLPDGSSKEIAVARPTRQPMVPLSEISHDLHIEYVVHDGSCEIRTEGSSEKPTAPVVVAKKPVVVPDTPGKTASTAPTRVAHKDPGVTMPETIDGSPRTQRTVASSVEKVVQNSSAGSRVTAVPNKIASWLGMNTSSAKAQKTVVASNVVPKSEPIRQDAPAPSKQAANVQTPQNLENPMPTVNTTVDITNKVFGSRKDTRPVKGLNVVRHIQSVSFEASDANNAKLVIKADGPVQPMTRVLQDPPRLFVEFPNSSLDGEQKDWKVSNTFVNEIHATNGSLPNCTRFVLPLEKTARYNLTQNSMGTGWDINLTSPHRMTSISDLTIVVDPGHGGSTGLNPLGCQATLNGKVIYEKDITLAVGKKVRAALEDAGARVIMTRENDVSLLLDDRPKVGTRSMADLFVSIHVDDLNSLPTNASGSTSYYHAEDRISKALAHCIIERVASVSGLPNRRDRSDYKLHPSGLGVLRGASIPATLVEMGFLMNPTDRHRLLDPEWQDKIAQAFVDGISDFINGGGYEGSGGTIVVGNGG